MTLEQTINPTSIPLAGLGYGPLSGLYGQQQLIPQSPIGNILAQLGPLTPYAVNPQIAVQAQLSSILSQLAHLSPYSVTPQFGAQGPFGGQFGQFGQQQPYGGGQQFGMQGPFSQLGQLHPYAGQQFAPQNLIATILSQLGSVSPYAVNPLLTSQWGQTQNPFLNPYAQSGGAFRVW